MRFARLLSLVAAVAVTATLLVYPYVLGPRLSGADHAALAVLLLGVSAAFVHGFGYVPRHRAVRLIFGPAPAWLLIMGAAAALAVW